MCDLINRTCNYAKCRKNASHGKIKGINTFCKAHAPTDYFRSQTIGFCETKDCSGIALWGKTFYEPTMCFHCSKECKYVYYALENYCSVLM
jgi:hypothetical protein